MNQPNVSDLHATDLQAMIDQLMDLSVTEDPEEIILRIADVIRLNKGEIIIGTILSWDRIRDYATLIATTNPSSNPQTAIGSQYSISKFPSIGIWRNFKGCVIIRDISSDPRIDQTSKEILKKANIAWLIYLPIKTKGFDYAQAIILMNGVTKREFSLGEEKLLNLIAQILSLKFVATLTAQIFEKRELMKEVIQQMKEALLNAVTEYDVLKAALFLPQLKGSRAYYSLIEREDGKAYNIRVKALIDENGSSMPLGIFSNEFFPLLLNHILRDGSKESKGKDSVLIYADIPTDMQSNLAEFYLKAKILSMIIIPLYSFDDVLCGTMGFTWTQINSSFSSDLFQ